MEIGEPVSKTFDVGKHFGWLVKIRSIPAGFSKLLKYVGSLTRFFRVYVAQNSEIRVFEISA